MDTGNTSVGASLYHIIKLNKAIAKLSKRIKALEKRQDKIERRRVVPSSW